MLGLLCRIGDTWVGGVLVLWPDCLCLLETFFNTHRG
jgi:hypothetical protein